MAAEATRPAATRAPTRDNGVPRAVPRLTRLYIVMRYTSALPMADIPQDDQNALQFIREKIDTVSHLETLLLLWKTRPGVWTAENVAKRIYVSPEAAQRLLRELADSGMIASAPGAQDAYLCDPAAGLSELIGQVDAFYRQNLVAVSRMIHAKPPAAVRQFADAFRLTKKDDK